MEGNDDPGGDADDGTDGLPTERRIDGYSPLTYSKLGTEFSPFIRKHCIVAGCGRSLKSSRHETKYCSEHRGEGQKEQKRRYGVRKRRQAQADRLRAAIPRSR